MQRQKLRNSLLMFFIVLIGSGLYAGDFKTTQLKSQRVRAAYEEKEQIMKDLLQDAGISNTFNLYIRILKKEALVQLYAANKGDDQYKLLKSFPVCFSSGVAGPKRRQGDLQVPEGIYHIERFNPWSSYYLSLGINYPNELDRRAAGNVNPGGDIFIHGSCVSIGCVPIEDENIRLLYILCVEAKDAGQCQIPVHIFPCRMDDAGMSWLKGQEAGHRDFWKSLRPAYTRFESEGRLPAISITGKEYVVADQ